jgi:hypothetical protein
MKSNSKKSLIERVKSIIITILVIIIILLSKCSGEQVETINIEPKKIVETIIQTDTVTVTKETIVPKWRTKIVKDTIKIEKLIEVDSLSIIQNYLEKYVYIDTIKIDTIGFLTLEDTIYKNEIIYRKPKIDIEIPIKTVNLIEKVNEREFYAGLGVRTTMNKYTWMGLEGSMRTKKGNLFLIGIGTDNNNNFSLGGSVHWKIMNE